MRWALAGVAVALAGVALEGMGKARMSQDGKCNLHRTRANRNKQPYPCLPPPLPSPQFLPFIQGPRNCLGQYFALLEARVILSTLCQVGRCCCPAVFCKASGQCAMAHPPPMLPLALLLPALPAPRLLALLSAHCLLPPPPPAFLQRFTFRPVDAQKQGETHPSVIPIAPKHGMRMYVA